MDQYARQSLRGALEKCRSHLVGVGIFSGLLNLLFIVPMLYMLQVYDRVVPTRGAGTLIMLTAVLLAGLGTLAMLDRVRSRLLVRASLRLEQELAGPLLNATLARADRPMDAVARQPMREFDTLRQTLTGPMLLALCDAPWAPFYVIISALIHPLLGLLVLVGGGVMGTVTWLNERATGKRLRSANEAAARAYAHQEQVLASAENVRALGMRGAMVSRHVGQRAAMLHLQTEASFSSGGYVAASKFLRLSLQSLALGLGAYLAIGNKISAGGIFAASFMAGRALSPIEQLLAAWPALVRARAAYSKLSDLLDSAAPSTALTVLPEPKGRVDVEQVMVGRTPETRILAGVNLVLEPGEVVTIVGPSGAGKSTLMRVIAGALVPDAGQVRIDGARLADWESDRLGGYIGYLPQSVSLFAGTVKENISRFAMNGDPAEIDAQVVTAAQAALAHDMILRLPSGYDTMLGWEGQGLSAGQAQRIALARALFRDPALLLLDEPNSHLDAEGEAQLLQTIVAAKARGAAVAMIAHRMSVLSVSDKIVVMREGRIEVAGARDEVIARLQRPADGGEVKAVRTKAVDPKARDTKAVNQ
ncbi:MAG TPA: type I secretion system permease/ATPase [Sphingomicrobium sp.]